MTEKKGRDKVRERERMHRRGRERITERERERESTLG